MRAMTLTLEDPCRKIVDIIERGMPKRTRLLVTISLQTTVEATAAP